MLSKLLNDVKAIQALIDLLPVAIFVKDAANRVVLMNTVCESVWGVKFSQIEGTDGSKYFPQEQVQQYKLRDQEVFKNRKLVEFEEAFWNAALQQNRIGHTLKKPYYDAQGNPQFMLCTTWDISEYRKIESALRVAATAFEANVGILITDANSVILRVNTAFTEQTGYTNDEVVGKTPRILKSNVHDRAFYQDMWKTLHETGTWQGEIWDRRKTGEIYPKWMTIRQIKDEAGNVTNYVGTQHDITYRKQTEEKIHHLINYDTLSELPNRRMLMEQLDLAQDRSAQSGQYGALLFLDVDNFKQLNDTRGHHYGDLFIIEVARRLQASVQKDSTVSRLGGDEFLVMMENIGLDSEVAVGHATALSNRIHATMSKAFMLEGFEYFASASIGITLFRGHEQQKVQLLTQADVAMYEAKKAGKNTQRFFDPEMQQALEQRAKLESSLRQALSKQQLKLFYQVQVNSHGVPMGVEALIRWDHPELGLIPPSQFIPLAEETHLILPIGTWVLDTACQQLRAWQGEESFSQFSISVNISALQFKQPDFVAQLQRIVEHHGVSPQQLKLELTESIVLDDAKEAIAKMKQLKSLGFFLSMDDFGTGYSSLNYLRRLPFDQLKIDRSFISNMHDNPHDAYVIEMIAAMADRFGMEIIAEGVESAEQYQYLSALGFQGFQGYYFGRPMPVEALERNLVCELGD